MPTMYPVAMYPVYYAVEKSRHFQSHQIRHYTILMPNEPFGPDIPV